MQHSKFTKVNISMLSKKASMDFEKKSLQNTLNTEVMNNFWKSWNAKYCKRTQPKIKKY